MEPVVKPKKNKSHLQERSAQFDVQQFNIIHEEMSFEDYLGKVYKNPKIIRTAYQRVYDMILEPGTYTYKKYYHLSYSIRH